MSSRSHGSRKTARRPTHNVTNPTAILRRKQKAHVAAVLAKVAAIQAREAAVRRQREELERELARLEAEEQFLLSQIPEFDAAEIESYFAGLDRAESNMNGY